MRIFTVGHSTRELETLLALLKQNQVECLVDVRSYPFSRRHPQFNQDSLERTLEAEGIGYHHLKTLGGRRKKQLDDSPNDAWEVRGFQNYADYMLSDKFKEGIDLLKDLAREDATAIMCAEASPFRCHRRLISDYLVALEGISVIHILDERRTEEHTLTPFARVEEDRVIYPGAQGSLFG